MEQTSASTDREVREKLAVRGVESLTDAELLSIIIKDGVAGRSALEIAESLLALNENSLCMLAKSDITALRMAEGIGMNRAAILAAAFEMSERIVAQKDELPAIICTKEDAVSLMRPIFSRLKHEEMWVIYLSSVNGVIEKTRVSQGGVTSLITDNKLILKRAVELLASSILIVHNHPSGIAEPSPEDIEMTDKLVAAAALLDILVVDHIIIAGDNAYSFRQQDQI